MEHFKFMSKKINSQSSFLYFIAIEVNSYFFMVIYSGSPMIYYWKPRRADYFLLLFCKSSIWFTEKDISKIVMYFF